MSADLFEAFRDSPKNEAPTPKQEDTVTARPHPHIWSAGPPSSAAIAQPGNVSRQKAEPPLWKPDQNGNDILFDAEDEHDDEFGDFEEVHDAIPAVQRVSASKQPAHSMISEPSDTTDGALVDLLSLDDAPTTAHGAGHPVDVVGDAALSAAAGSSVVSKNDTHQDRTEHHSQEADDNGWGDFEDVRDVGSSGLDSAATNQSAEYTGEYLTGPQLEPQHATVEEDDGWDAFEDGPTTASESTIKQQKPSASTRSVSRDPKPEADWAAFEDGPTPSISSNVPASTSANATTSIPANAVRPTNIPPPAIVLSLLPTIYATLQDPGPGDVKSLYHATARIIAGRSLRWRRDTLLSQSTRISAAGAGGRAGMKLSSLNKSETVREEREASEALNAWSAKVAVFAKLLRDAPVKTLKLGKQGLRLHLPLMVRTLPSSAGALEAGYTCPICGMKRNERVQGVDEGEEDVFGEFWVDGWGHTACAEVWYKWKRLLSQR